MSLFVPPFWLRNPHVQTIVPRYLVKCAPEYQRLLIKDSYGQSDVAFDFLYADDKKDAQGKFSTPLVVLFHGLEGSSQSHYAKTLATRISQAGYHFVVAHFRSCGGVAVAGELFYNAGDTTEAHHYLGYLSQRFATIYAIGVSLGGNVLAKYMGEYGSDALAKRAVVVSAPVDLASAGIAMRRLMGKHVYTPYLLNSLVKKALANQLSSEELAGVKAARDFGAFDHAFTAPRHGYRSGNDYYHRASALPYLKSVTRPTLIITAKDDPFLGLTAKAGDVSDDVVLLDTRYGGHIGFVDYDVATRRFKLDFVAAQALRFFGLT